MINFNRVDIMPLFGKKEEAAPAQPPQQPGGTLIDAIVAMQQQGYSDDDIVAQLQSQGVPPEQIQDAMSQAGMATGGPLPQDYGQQGQGQMPPMGPPQGMPPGPGMPSGPAPGREQIEEIAESIVQEKWNDLLKDLNKISEWKTKTETDMAKIQSDIDNIKQTFDNLHKGVLGKIGEYDKNLSMVGTEIKAMEKVFQKVLPTFTDNVNKLERLTKRVSKK
ncbi:hypothetical protein ACFLZ6_00555 [Nanoarchaeota archaeon]